ncbi:MAG: hypothetical protein Q7U57_18415 [Methylovulum sp.]|nr:hypothetical protein [Methylovulum sp.]
MIELEITSHSETDNPIINTRLLYSFKATKCRMNTAPPHFILSGWIIDKKQAPINIVTVIAGIKVCHDLNVIKHVLAKRMGKKLGFSIDGRCGFAFRIEAVADVDLFIEIDNNLVPWKKVKVITTSAPSIPEKDTAAILQKFKEANFSAVQEEDYCKKSTFAQYRPNDTFAIAIEALFFFFSNRFNEISSQHIDEVNALYGAIAQNISTFWREVKRLSLADALNEPTLKSHLKRLVEELKNDKFAIGLAESAITNNLSLPSPFSSAPAYCRESYEVDGGFTCLRFTDGRHCFFLIQGVSSADALYFPSDNTFLAFAAVKETQIQSLKKKLISDFAKTVDYVKAENSFFGIIASHNRPSHFYYDIWPTLVELSERPALVAQLPNVIMRSNHDFNHADLLFGEHKCLVLDSGAINALALDEHKWFFHAGTRLALSNRYLYERADRALVKNAISTPGKTALEKIKHLDGCYPIVWIGVEGQKRCWLEQIEGYAYILNQLLKKYPKLGVVFDGWTLPLTPSEGSISEAEKDLQVANKIVKKVSPRFKFVSVVGEPSHIKLAVGNTADFFISNYATGSMHISRMLGKPGFCHLSRRFSDVALRQAMHIHPNHHVYLLPQQYITDEDEEVMHDRLSYSIDKKVFYRFIESKLDNVLNADAATSIKIFIEPPYTVNPELRNYLKMATNGNLIQIFPGKKAPNKLEELTGYSETYLNNNLVYDAFSYRAHKKIIGSAHYLIWLGNPLERVYFHAAKLAKITASDKDDGGRMLDVFNIGHKSLDNYLTRMVSDTDAAFGQCTELMLEKAIDNLKHEFIFIGLDDRQSESFDLLCAVMDWDRSLFPNEMPHKFTINHDGFAENVHSAAKAMVSYDLRLYQTAVALFDDRLKSPEKLMGYMQSYNFYSKLQNMLADKLMPKSTIPNADR